MSRAQIALVLVCVQPGLSGQEKDVDRLFEECVIANGREYIAAVARLPEEAVLVPYLQGIALTKDLGPDRLRLARILLARSQRPDLFKEFGQLIEGTRKSSKFTSIGRPGTLRGNVLSFARSGPESRYVYEFVGLKDDGPVRDIEEKKVEKYSEDDVRRGKARNAAARQAVLEYFVKQVGECTEFEQSELFDAVFTLWGEKSIERIKDELTCDDLVETTYRDEKRPVGVRVKAAFLLPERMRDEVMAFMLGVLRSDETNDQAIYGRTVASVIDYLRTYGGDNVFTVLKGLEPKARWKRELVESMMLFR